MNPKLILGLALVVLVGRLTGFCGEIHDAAARGDLEKVKALVKSNPSLVFSRKSHGETPLLFAASSDRKDVVKFLLANKADINDPAINPRAGIPGFTPLQDACRLGHKEMVELLLAHHADVNARDYQQDTCLHLAATSFHPDVMAVLLSHGMDINATNYIGMTALHLAAMEGRTAAVAFLLTNNASINCRNSAGMTPLMWGAFQGHMNVVELLLTNKAEINAKDLSGHTALHYAASKGFTNIVQLLLASHADVKGDGPLIKKALQPTSNDGASQITTPKLDVKARILKSHQELAEKGDAYGELRMGLRYRDGDGVPRDLDKAREWLQKAADQGSPEAITALAKLPKPKK